MDELDNLQIFDNIHLQLSDADFLEKINYDKYDEGMRVHDDNLGAFPSDHALAIFSNLAYKDEITLPQELYDWEVLAHAMGKGVTNGYVGVAFLNPKLCHVVIAHRGTVKTKIGALLADFKLALNFFRNKQAQSAMSFVHLVSDKIKKVNEENNDKPPFLLSITGHSLGAWLAQYTTFTVKYLTVINDKFRKDNNYISNIHPHTVVFESPGCRESLEQLLSKLVYQYCYRKFGKYDTLDMTVYLNKPNFINSVKRQVGTIYMLPINSHDITEIINYFETGEKEKKVLLQMTSGIISSLIQLGRKLTGGHNYRKLDNAPDNKCSLNVFSEYELEFVKEWSRLKLLNSSSIRNVKESLNFPPFELNYDYHCIISPQFKKIILKVKNERVNDLTILTMLQDDVTGEICSSFFEDNVKPLSFNDFYFIDNYGLLKFLQSKKKIFQIKISSKEYDLELGIVNNLICYYRHNVSTSSNISSESKIAFMDWSKLSKFIDKLPNLSEYKLLIIVVEDEDKNINKFLQKVQSYKSDTRVIILSTNALILNDFIVQTVEEFGSKLSYSNLNNESQEKFLIRKVFRLNNKSLNLKSILKITNENKNSINRFPKNSILELVLAFEPEIVESQSVEIFENGNENWKKLKNSLDTFGINLDCRYNNILKSVLFYDLYEEIDPNIELQSLEGNVAYLVREDESEVSLDNVFSNINVKELSSVKDYEDVCFKDILAEGVEAKYLFTTKNGKLFLTSIFNHNFYINRSIIHKRIVNPNIFKRSDENTLDYFIFYGNQEVFNEYQTSNKDYHFKFVSSLDKVEEERLRILQQLHQLRKQNQVQQKEQNQDEEREQNQNEQKKQNQETKPLQQPATIMPNFHIFKVNQDKSIDWQKTYGDINVLHGYMESKEILIKEKDIVDDDRIIILSGEPGMGKSSILEFLFLKSQHKYWIFPIQLRNFNFDEPSDNLSYDIVAHFLARYCYSKAECIPNILSFCLQYGSTIPIYIMFDSFDEIHKKELKKKVIDIINFLKLNTNVKILITTRPHDCKTLENELSVFSSLFKGLNYEREIVKFLVTFWETHFRLFVSNRDHNYLQSVAENMLKSAQKTIGETIQFFIEIPINMRLLAETVTPDMYSKSIHIRRSFTDVNDIQLQFTDVLTLYNKYVKQRCGIYFKRFSLDPHPTVKSWLMESILGKISALSINQLLNVEIQNLNEEEMEEFYKVGLVYWDYNNSTYKFLHESVCDYFISDSIKQWMTEQMYILFVEYDVPEVLISDLFLKNELKNVRLFLNYHLKMVEITPNRINLCRNKFLELYTKNAKIFFNEEKESVFHICINENLKYLLHFFLFKLLDSAIANRILMESTNQLETPLYYAIKKTREEDNPKYDENCLTLFLDFLSKNVTVDEIKEIFLATLFNYFISKQDLDKLSKYVSFYPKLQKILTDITEMVPLNCELKEENTEDATDEQEQDRIIVQTKNENLEVQNKDEANKESKNEEKRHLNNFNKEYLTAFIDNDSITLKKILRKFENDKLILEYLLKSTNAKRETGIHLMTNMLIEEQLPKIPKKTKKTASISIPDVNLVDILVNPFNINLQDLNGMTPLCRSIKRKQTDVSKILIKKGALYLKDRSDLTPAMHAAKYGEMEILKIILDRKATEVVDVNDGNKYKMTPIMFAAKNGHIDIVTYLIDKKAIADQTDCNGRTALFYAVAGGHTNIVKVLYKKYKCNLNVQDGYGLTPLLYIVKHKNIRMIESLLSLGANVNIGSFQGDYPIQYLIKEKMNTYIEKFIKLSADTSMLTEIELDYIKSLKSNPKK